MMHDMMWPMMASGILQLTVLGLAAAALVKYLFFTARSPGPTH